MKKFYLFFENQSRAKLSILFVFFSFFISSAQVTTNSGSGLAATYPDLATAITALNGATITSPVVITLTGNETAPAGGYSITAQGDATNTIIIEGVTSTITANAALTVGALNDAIFKLVGADYVTIRTFTMQENAGNTVTAAATNTMTEWGIAVLYASTSNGSNNVTLSGNTIDLVRTYQNTFGIYSNSTHGAATPTTSATAIAGGGNNNLTIIGNTITDVNNGILVVGATTSPEHNDNLVIGGFGNANIITNYGATGTFSAYANVSGTIYGICVRNTKNYNISYNDITSSGLNTAGTIRGIFVQAPSAAVTIGTFTQVINNNILAIKSGFITGGIGGVEVANTTGTLIAGTLSIANNDFNNYGHTTPTASGTVAFINSTYIIANTSIVNNTFTNVSLNTTGSSTLISNSVTMPAGGSRSISDNRIVGTFAKTGAGGTVTIYNAGDSSTNGTTAIANNNNFSNITLTGATTFSGWNSNDGFSATSGPAKTFTNNVFSNLSLGSSASTIVLFGWGGSTSQISNNTINNVTASGTVVGFSFPTNNNVLSVFQNTINGITTTGTSINGVQVASGVISFARNKVVNLESNNAAGFVNGLTISAGIPANSHLIANNIIGDLRAPITSLATDAIKGINITSTTATTANNIYNNSIYLAATSSGVNFSTSGVFHTYSATATTSALDLRNNVIVNNSVSNGTGNIVAIRRTAATDLNNFATTSNNNDLVGPNIYADGTNLDATLGAYQTRVATRESLSISVLPAFLSLASSNANFLHVDPAIPTFLESSATAIGSVTNDFDGDIRQGVGGYVGTGLSPDMGADEFEGIPSTPQCAGTPAATNALSSVTSACSGVNFNLSLSTSYSELNYTYQWQSSPDGIAPYTNIIGQNGATASVNQTAATFYQCIITCSNSGFSATSTPVQVTMSSIFVCYCASTYANGTGATGGDAITNVTLGTLNNSSNGGATATPSPYYTFYNAVTVPDLEQGSGRTMTISFGADGSQFAGVWIDYNQDGDFGDVGEFVANNTVTAGANGTTTLNFNVPLTATLGQTMMRVRGGNDAVLTNTPCGVSSSTWGETEDYIVNITPCVAPAITIQPTATISVCENAAVNLSVVATGTALTYQWRKDGVDIATATSASYSIPSALVADSGSYTVLVTGACGTILSDPSVVTVTANSSLATEVVSACDTYTWAANGTTYTASGIYTSTTSCVTRTLDLTINLSTTTTTNVTVCDTYTWAENGTTYTVGGTYTNVTTNGAGCPNTATLNLVVTNASIDFANLQFPAAATICEGGTMTAYGQVFEAGLTEAAGQASGIDVEFGYNSTNTNPNTWSTWAPATFNVQVANNDEYLFTTSNALVGGTYYYTFRYRLSGCSTWQYGGDNNGFWNGTTQNSGVLTITPNSSSPTEVVSACDTYTWAANGTTYTTSGIYTSTTACVTRTLDLTINLSTTTTTNVTVCDTYTWAENGTTYTVGGTYTNVTTNGAGCPNTATLNLVVTNASIDFANLQFPAAATICEGGTMTAYGQVFEAGLTEAAGQASGIDVEFGYNSTNTNPNTWSTWAPATFNVQAGNNDEYQFTTSNALVGGTYYYTFRYRLSGCSTWQYGGDNNGFWNGTTQNSGVLTIDSAATPTGASTQTLNGGVAADVTIEDIVVSGTGIIWYPTALDATNNTNAIAAGTVLTDNTYYYAVSVNGICRSASFEVLVTVVLGNASFDLSQLNYYPNPVKDIFNVKYNKEIISVDVYDLTGRKVIEMKPNTLEVQLNMTNLSNAMYIVRLQSVDGITELKVYKN